MNSSLSLDVSESFVLCENFEVKTNDEKIFNTNKKVLSNSGLMSIIFEDKECFSVDLKEVSSIEFEYVLEYLNLLHTNRASEIPKPIIDTSLKTYLQPWELEYLEKIQNNKMLAKIASVSNYLDIKTLLELCCAKIAGMLKGKIHTNEIDKIIDSL